MRGRSESRASGGASAGRAAGTSRRSRLIDRAARGAAAGMTRRDLVRLGAGAAVAAALPAAAWPTAAPAAKQRGTCATRPRGTCPPGTTPGKWRPGAAQAIDSGVASTFNGCGPESGIRLPLFGKTDPVPDRPLLLANFFEGCKAHDCCYGVCGSDQAQCDRAFLEQGLKACARTHVGRGEIEKGLLLACNKVAQLYHFAVSSGGRAAWGGGAGDGLPVVREMRRRPDERPAELRLVRSQMRPWSRLLRRRLQGHQRRQPELRRLRQRLPGRDALHRRRLRRQMRARSDALRDDLLRRRRGLRRRRRLPPARQMRARLRGLQRRMLQKRLLHRRRVRRQLRRHALPRRP